MGRTTSMNYMSMNALQTWMDAPHQHHLFCETRYQQSINKTNEMGKMKTLELLKVIYYILKPISYW
jgi:hypothetical protein